MLRCCASSCRAGWWRWPFLAGDGLLGLLALPYWLGFGLSLVLLDLTLYWQHRLFHRIDFLWALHGAHHGDRNLNVSSGLRFHPGEALVSFAIKAIAVMVLGVPVAAVILFEILLNGASLFNHANWSLGRADRWIEKLIVTPDMHRLHHSRLDDESRKNFGFFLSIWDRLFASYQAEPKTRMRPLPLVSIPCRWTIWRQPFGIRSKAAPNKPAKCE